MKRLTFRDRARKGLVFAGCFLALIAAVAAVSAVAIWFFTMMGFGPDATLLASLLTLGVAVSFAMGLSDPW